MVMVMSKKEKFGYQPPGKGHQPGSGRGPVEGGYQPERSERAPTQRPTPPKKD